MEETADLQERIEDFFRPLGDLRCVRMRRYDVKRFKGSVFAEFGSKNDIDNILVSLPLTFNENELLVMRKPDYIKMKAEERKNMNGLESKKPLVSESKWRKRLLAFRDCIPTTDSEEDKIPLHKLKKAVEDVLLTKVFFVRFADNDDKSHGWVELKLQNAESAFQKAKEDNLLNEQSEWEIDVAGAKVKFRHVTGDEERDYWSEDRLKALLRDEHKGGKGGFNKKRRGDHGFKSGKKVKVDVE